MFVQTVEYVFKYYSHFTNTGDGEVNSLIIMLNKTILAEQSSTSFSEHLNRCSRKTIVGHNMFNKYSYETALIIQDEIIKFRSKTKC